MKPIEGHVFVSYQFNSCPVMTILVNLSQQGNTYFQWGRECYPYGKGQIFTMAMVDTVFGIWWSCGITALLYVSKIELIVSP